MSQPPRQRGLVRQWRIVRALQEAKRGLTMAQLHVVAQEDVHTRTLRRDIDTLTIAGFPIDVLSGRSYPETRVIWRTH